jgi:hypothetical protein
MRDPHRLSWFPTRSIVSAFPFAFCPLASGGFTNKVIPEVVDEGKHGFENFVVCSDVVVLLTDIVAEVANRSRNFFISAVLPNERHKAADHNEFCWRESTAFDRLGKFRI